ncbi:unnamed protein product [Umbelopsis ramanniana]
MKFIPIVLIILVTYSLTIAATKDGNLRDQLNSPTQPKSCDSHPDYDADIFKCIDGILCLKGAEICGNTCYNPSLSDCCGEQLVSLGSSCEDLEVLEEKGQDSEEDATQEKEHKHRHHSGTCSSSEG